MKIFFIKKGFLMENILILMEFGTERLVSRIIVYIIILYGYLSYFFMIYY